MIPSFWQRFSTACRPVIRRCAAILLLFCASGSAVQAGCAGNSCWPDYYLRGDIEALAACENGRQYIRYRYGGGTCFGPNVYTFSVSSYRLINDAFISQNEGEYFFPTPACPAGQRFLAPGSCQPDTPVPEKNHGTPHDCNAAKGNPCNAATGNKFQAESDKSSASGLDVTRFYNSQFGEDLGFGFGWTSTLASKRLNVNGFTVQVLRRDAKGETFTCGATCIGDPDTHLRLVDNRPGFTLKLPDGTNELFDATGKLLSETSSTGQITTYGYDTNGKLSTVTDAFGHALTFGYDTNNHIATVTDPANKIIYYDYDDTFPAPVPATPAGNLTRVRYPDATAKIYHYENASFPNHLTGISYVDSAGVITRYATYAYDPTGKATLTQHAQTDNPLPQERFTLNYDSATQTTVTDPVNMQEIMTFTTNLGVKNLVTKTNSIDTKSLQQTFNSNNNLTCRKDEENRVTTYNYNTTNQRIGMTEGLMGDCANPVPVAGVTRTTT